MFLSEFEEQLSDFVEIHEFGVESVELVVQYTWEGYIDVNNDYAIPLRTIANCLSRTLLCAIVSISSDQH